MSALTTFTQTLTYWLKGKQDLATDAQAIQEQIDAIDRMPPTAEVAKLRERREAKERLLGELADVLAARDVATKQAEKAQEAADNAAHDARHAEAAKLTAVGIKLTRKIGNAAKQMAVDLAELERIRNVISDANKVRGRRDLIADPEFEVRKRPGEHQEAIIDHNTVWVDDAGEVVQAEVYDAGYNRWIDNPARVRQIQKPYFAREEMTFPPTMPLRLAGEITLVDLMTGAPLWPPRAQNIGGY